MNRLLSRLRHSKSVGSNGNGDGGHVRVVGPSRRGSARGRYVVTSAEAAPCTCPDVCERDHGAE